MSDGVDEIMDLRRVTVDSDVDGSIRAGTDAVSDLRRRGAWLVIELDDSDLRRAAIEVVDAIDDDLRCPKPGESFCIRYGVFSCTLHRSRQDRQCSAQFCTAFVHISPPVCIYSAYTQLCVTRCCRSPSITYHHLLRYYPYRSLLETSESRQHKQAMWH